MLAFLLPVDLTARCDDQVILACACLRESVFVRLFLIHRPWSIVAAAKVQINRIARQNIGKEELNSLVEDHIEIPMRGIGPFRVALNLAFLR